MEAYILIVQEDFTSQQLLKQFLTSNGYNVDCADDGLEGIHMYKENDYDLIILGVNLPNLDGFSVCTMIRIESQIPIIFLTQANTEEDQIRGFELLCRAVAVICGARPPRWRELFLGRRPTTRRTTRQRSSTRAHTLSSTRRDPV